MARRETVEARFATRCRVAAALFVALAFGQVGCGGPSTLGTIERKDPRLDALLAPDARIEILADGYDWAEGPVWVKHAGYLLFSDVPSNRICRWKRGEGARTYLRPSGGSNGLAIDTAGRLVLCQHGDRRLARMEVSLERPAPRHVTLAGEFEGKRLNSPNDLVFHTDGAIYFTDPPYGLPKGMGDPGKELDFQGVYRLGTDGELTLLTREMTRPNGIGLSPDERTLYVANSDPMHAAWYAFPVEADGTLGAGRVFADFTAQVGGAKGLPDGLKVDEQGNLWATGPGGVIVFAPDGTHLGTLATGEATSNCAWGEDGSTLFITADQYLARIRTRTKGLRF